MSKFAVKSCGSVLALALGLTAVPAFAQSAAPADAPAADAAADAMAHDEIVVTGVSRAANRLDTSISVSSLNADAISAAAPRSAA